MLRDVYQWIIRIGLFSWFNQLSLFSMLLCSNTVEWPTNCHLVLFCIHQVRNTFSSVLGHNRSVTVIFQYMLGAYERATMLASCNVTILFHIISMHAVWTGVAVTLVLLIHELHSTLITWTVLCVNGSLLLITYWLMEFNAHIRCAATWSIHYDRLLGEISYAEMQWLSHRSAVTSILEVCNQQSGY